MRFSVSFPRRKSVTDLYTVVGDSGARIFKRIWSPGIDSKE
jgi:hypothetical protein